MDSLAVLFQRWRYLLLLGALAMLLVVEPIASSLGILSSLFDALFFLVMVMLVFTLSQNRTWRIVASLLCVPIVGLSIGGRFLATPAHEALIAVGHGLGALFFVAVAANIVRSIFASNELSLDSIFGAICGYLLVGVAWGIGYAMVDVADPDAFHFDDAIQPHMEVVDYRRHAFIYHSFVTLTTVGYGDVTPVSIAARTLSWVEAVTGQLYLAVLIAGLISAMVARNSAPNV